MKAQQITGAVALMLATAQATPTKYAAPPGGWDSIKYPAPPGGWDSIKYPAPPGGWESIKYPPGTGENLPSYPPPKGDKPPTTPAPAPAPAPAPEDCKMTGPFKFTSTYSITAVPDQVIGDDGPTGGQAGAIGYYNYGINSELNYICYSIKLVGLGDAGYQSAAATSTHIHEAARGSAGPPRISLENPVQDPNDPNVRYTFGCQQGPFVTGLDDDDGVDTGVGFTVAEIENNPSAFFTDVHTDVAVPGAVRGQFPSG